MESDAVPENRRPRRISPAAGVFTKLPRSDRNRLLTHLLRLDSEDRQRRFCGTVSDAHISAYCRGADTHRRIVVVCRADGIIRGAGELVISAPSPGRPRAEIALSVERCWQDAGIGTELLRRVLVIARNRGIPVVEMVSLRDNRRLLAVARKFGATFSSHHGTVEMRFVARAADPLSLLEESLGDGFGLWRTLIGSGRAGMTESAGMA